MIGNGWGHIEIEGLGRLRDAKLWPGGGRAWDWAETGTRHSPGIQPGDVEELLDHDPRVVVLSRGRQRRLETCPETLHVLEARHVAMVHEETAAAVESYGALARAGERVAALIHTTC